MLLGACGSAAPAAGRGERPARPHGQRLGGLLFEGFVLGFRSQVASFEVFFKV